MRVDEAIAGWERWRGECACARARRARVREVRQANEILKLASVLRSGGARPRTAARVGFVESDRGRFRGRADFQDAARLLGIPARSYVLAQSWAQLPPFQLRAE